MEWNFIDLYKYINIKLYTRNLIKTFSVESMDFIYHDFKQWTKILTNRIYNFALVKRRAQT